MERRMNGWRFRFRMLQMWTCDTPYLYDFTVEMVERQGSRLFCHEKIHTGKRWTGIRADLPEPSGTVSDWSTGSGLLAGWTVYRTSDEAMIFDLEQMKEMRI